MLTKRVMECVFRRAMLAAAAREMSLDGLKAARGEATPDWPVDAMLSSSRVDFRPNGRRRVGRLGGCES